MARPSTEQIRRFILSNVDKHPGDIARLTAEEYGFSRQAANSHLSALVDAGELVATGHTRGRSYALRVYVADTLSMPNSPDLAEDVVWRRGVARHFDSVPAMTTNVRDICHYGFTEMFNNVIDHSDASWVSAEVSFTSAHCTLVVGDDGVGIFKKIADALELEDPGQSILELSKGKVTTDPKHHTGQGIFFTSRMFDEFSILSGQHYFIHRTNEDDWLAEDRATSTPGTLVTMRIAPWADRTVQEVFDRFATEDDDYAFSKTRVPIKLMVLKDEPLVSRSQAKRLVTRFNRFKTVVLDFDGVETIGQAFADEVFRVFQNEHPSVQFELVNANESINRMVRRARSNMQS